MIHIQLNGINKLCSFIAICFLCSCCNKFSTLSKYNKLEKGFVFQFINDSAKFNFTTNGDYLFYNSKRNFKPTKHFNKQDLNPFVKDGFKALALAETDLSPYYTLGIFYKKDKKFIPETDSLFSYRKGRLITVGKKITYNDNCFIVKFTWDESLDRDLFEDSLNFKTEFDFIISSITFSPIAKKSENDITTDLIKDNPVLAIKIINNLNLDSISFEKADLYLDLKATAWTFINEWDSVKACINCGELIMIK